GWGGGPTRAQGRTFRLEVPAEPTTVPGDGERRQRAVSNILSNAVKGSPPQGAVRVAVAHGEVSVRDAGPGIDEADLPFVFERFYRAPAARGMPGSGLRLAVGRH